MKLSRVAIILALGVSATVAFAATRAAHKATSASAILAGANGQGVTQLNLQFGLSELNFQIDATAWLAMPVCSKSAGCEADLLVCQSLSNSQQDAAHCLPIRGSNQNNWLWLGVQQTTKTSTGGTSSTSYHIGTLRTSIPPGETNQQP